MARLDSHMGRARCRSIADEQGPSEQREPTAGEGLGGRGLIREEAVSIAILTALSAAAAFVMTQQHRKIHEGFGTRMNPLSDPGHACAAFGIGICVEGLQRKLHHGYDAREWRKPPAAATAQRPTWLTSANSDQLMDGSARKSAAEQRVDRAASDRNARPIGMPWGRRPRRLA